MNAQEARELTKISPFNNILARIANQASLGESFAELYSSISGNDRDWMPYQKDIIYSQDDIVKIKELGYNVEEIPRGNFVYHKISW